jgi:hypothetical protein
VERGDADAE